MLPLNYWLYTLSDPYDGMPLVVYLHGRSGKGDDLSLITGVDGFAMYLEKGLFGDLRSYVLIPQFPSSVNGWMGAEKSVMALIEAVVEEYGIDRDNISLTGHSMGGSAVWKFALRENDVFSRFAPLSGSIELSPLSLMELKDCTIWAFVGAEDTIVPPLSSIEMVSALEKAGENARITVFDGADHFAVPRCAYLSENLSFLSWLIGEDDW